ncbi:MAG: YraN family protein [Desulfuromonadales bacterium]|nr:YraN family protein [Desulfuromonadales bacterium]
MTEQRLTLGRRGEEAAARYLKKQGMKLIERNMRTPVGEIDLIMRHKRCIVFIEVKTRSSQDYGAPAEAVGARKQRQIIRAATWYLNEGKGGKTLFGQPLQPRFDVVAVLMQGEGCEVEHIVGAFEV